MVSLSSVVYPNLSTLHPIQLEFIRESLTIQTLADHGDSSALDIVTKCYCHAGVYCLERGYYSPVPTHFLTPQFRSADYCCKRPKLLDLQLFLFKMISQYKQPFVVHMYKDNPEGDPQLYTIYHTFLVLGYDQAANIITWEKVASSAPFRISTISQIFNEYEFPETYSWGARRIFTPQEVI